MPRARPPAPPPPPWEDWILPGLVGAAALTIGIGLWRRRGGADTGYYAGPVVPGGEVLSRYGPRTKDGETKMHNGIDLEADRGTPIHAVSRGEVVAVWPDGVAQGYGNTVVIEHKPGEASLYAHMDSIDPAMVVGARVEPGQVVGRVGCTDSEGGFPCWYAHCHFEILLPAAGDRNVYHHIQGGFTPNPPRMDPALWAQQRNIRLI